MGQVKKCNVGPSVFSAYDYVIDFLHAATVKQSIHAYLVFACCQYTIYCRKISYAPHIRIVQCSNIALCN